MSKGVHDIFTRVINFLGANRQPKHDTLGLFLSANNSRNTLTKNLIKLSKKYNLNFFIIAYVEDKGSNLNTMTIALSTFVNCDILGLEKLLRHLLLACIFQDLSICYNRFFFCKYLTYDRRCAKVYNFA
jgi:hypothetical protein